MQKGGTEASGEVHACGLLHKPGFSGLTPTVDNHCAFPMHVAVWGLKRTAG